MRWLARAAAFLGVVCATSLLGAATNYTFTTIDVPGLTKVQATGVNNAGQIVGYGLDSSGAYASFLYSGGVFTPVSVPGSTGTQAFGISNSGQIVGSFSDGNGTHAFLDNAGSFTSISVPGSQCCEQAHGINNAGQIAGYFQSNPTTSGYQNGSFLYSGGSVTTIVSPGDFATEAFGINNSGQIVGSISNPRGGSHPFLYQGGVFTPITPPCCGDSSAAAINNAGQILVNTSASFLYDNGVYGDAIVFPGAQKTIASAINDSGAIAGYYVDSSSITHGFYAIPLAVSNPATAISIDFVGTGTPMAATETAGVVTRAHWNAANGASSSATVALSDENGAATGATVAWHSDNTWSTPITDTPGDHRMMKGYLDNGSGNPVVVTVTNLPVSSTGYDVYVYADGSNGGGNRTGSYRISGAGITTSTSDLTDFGNINFNGPYSAGGNYAKFSINAMGFTITATPGSASDSTPRAPVNGIQIVPSSGVLSDFTISAGSPTQTVAPGGTASYPVTVTAANSFNGTVALNTSGLPAGASATFTPASITGSGSSTLHIATTAATPSGLYTITITGTSGTLTHSTTTQLVVSGGAAATAISIDFVGNGTVMLSTEAAGVVGKANWNAAAGASSSSALALRDENGTATSATLTWRSDDPWSTPITDAPGNARMMKGYLDTGSENSTVVTVANLPASSTGYDVYVYADGNNGGGVRNGGYQISGAGITTSTLNLTDIGGADFSGTFANGGPGNYVKFTINASGFTLTATPGSSSDSARRAPVNGIQIVPAAGSIPDFTVGVNPGTQTVAPGGTGTYSATVGSLNGFSGAVTLSASGVPSGATANFTSASVPGGSGSSGLQIVTTAATPPGIYTITINGTSGSLSHGATTQLVVSGGSPAKAISIDFVGTGTVMAATETAGVAPKANWNAAGGASSGAAMALVDENGAGTGATATWQSDNTWSTLIADAPGNARMMRGYLDNGFGGNALVTVSNLPASASGYDIYVYLDGSNGGGARSGSYQISGIGITTTTVTATDAANTNFSGTLTQANGSAGNYVKFTINAAGFVVTAVPGATSDSTPRAPINGIQVVPH